MEKLKSHSGTPLTPPIGDSKTQERSIAAQLVTSPMSHVVVLTRSGERPGAEWSLHYKYALDSRQLTFLPPS